MAPPTIGDVALQSLLTDPEATGTWTLVPGRCSVRFTSKTMWGLVPVHGRFTDVHGDARISPEGSLSGRLEIVAASVRTGIAMRDRHLCAADFFDAEQHPMIVVEVSAAPGADLAATLQIRGTTLPLPLQAAVNPLGDGAVEFTVRAQIDRTRWGVSGNMAGMMPTTTTLSADAVFAKSAV